LVLVDAQVNILDDSLDLESEMDGKREQQASSELVEELGRLDHFELEFGTQRQAADS
jgi:hypothetical protein